MSTTAQLTYTIPPTDGSRLYSTLDDDSITGIYGTGLKTFSSLRTPGGRSTNTPLIPVSSNTTLIIDGFIRVPWTPKMWFDKDVSDLFRLILLTDTALISASTPFQMPMLQGWHRTQLLLRIQRHRWEHHSGNLLKSRLLYFTRKIRLVINLVQIATDWSMMIQIAKTVSGFGKLDCRIVYY